jgi:uncharacterized damage-inducible protein DinB
MQLKDYIQKTYDYSYWANKRYLSVAEGLPERKLRGKQGHSWGDVYSVLLHMLSSETVGGGGRGDLPKGHLTLMTIQR